jgi:thiol-disulfide isomerase/thioredoxin
MKKICTAILALFINQLCSFGNGVPAKISGSLPFLKNGDSVKLVLFKYGFFEYEENFHTVYHSKVVDHSFHFEIPVGNYPLYFNLTFKGNYNAGLYAYLIESGDDIYLSKDQDNIIFRGRGSAKWNFISRLNKLKNVCLTGLPEQSNLSSIQRRFELTDSCAVTQLNFLNSNKGKLSEKAFLFLKSDIVSRSLMKTYFLENMKDSEARMYVDELSKYRDHLDLDSTLNEFIAKNDNDLKYSWNLTPALLSKYYYDSCVAVNKPFSTRTCYDYFVKNYHGELREKLITYLLLEHKIGYSKRWFEDISSCIDDAIGYVKNKDFRNYLGKLLSIKEGEISYNFSLPDINGNVINMTDLRGKVVLLDFWFTGCPNCILIQPWLKKIEEKFKNDSISFVTISTDKDKNTWLRSIKEGKYTSPGTVDLFTEGKGADHKIIKHYNIVGYPTLILIDKEGKLCATPVDPRVDSGKHLIFLIEQALMKNSATESLPVN